MTIANWSSGSSGSTSSDGGSGAGKQKAAAVLMDLPAGRWHDMIAGIGYGGRSVLMTGVGFFFFMAGVQHDSYEVEGP